MLLPTGRTRTATVIALAALAGPLIPLPGAAAPAPGELVLVSASAEGQPSNGLSSFGLSASADGRYVAFASMATNLHPEDTDQSVDVYVKDLHTGAVRLASQNADGVKGDALSIRPSISADGQRVAFASAAGNLSPDDADGYFDLYVKDLRSGALTVASRTADGTKAAGGVNSAVLSADGSTAAFSSAATNLSPEATDGESHVYVKRLDTGELTLADGGVIARPDEQIGASTAALSADGGVVAFVTDAAGLDPADTDRRADVYVRSLTSGEVRLASANAEGVKGALPSTGASLSADGSRVAFETSSGNLVPEDADDNADVYVKDLPSGSLQLASTDALGTKADRTAGYPSLSPDGRYLAFSSDATNLGLPTAPLVHQVYRKDLVTGELLPVSVATGGEPAGDHLSIEPSITGDGAVVAFVSPSTNLAPDGGNRVADVFAKVFLPTAPPDTTVPCGHVTASPTWLSAFRGERSVVIAGSGSDDGGVSRIEISVTDEYGTVEPAVPPVEAAGQPAVSWKRAVTLSTWLSRGDDMRTYRVTATITDLAGNVTTVSTRVFVAGIRR
jgi:Tol biopolymer transport system component